MNWYGWQPCVTGCGTHGTCNSQQFCTCNAGWAGANCEFQIGKISALFSSRFSFVLRRKYCSISSSSLFFLFNIGLPSPQVEVTVSNAAVSPSNLQAGASSTLTFTVNSPQAFPGVIMYERNFLIFTFFVFR